MAIALVAAVVATVVDKVAMVVGTADMVVVRVVSSEHIILNHSKN